jgi:hypothetical protein
MIRNSPEMISMHRQISLPAKFVSGGFLLGAALRTRKGSLLESRSLSGLLSWSSQKPEGRRSRGNSGKAKSVLPVKTAEMVVRIAAGFDNLGTEAFDFTSSSNGAKNGIFLRGMRVEYAYHAI